MQAKIHTALLAAAILLGSGLLGFGISQADAAEKHSKNPCQQIEKACKSAGFVYGDSKQGKGIMRDCVNPIMQSKPAPGPMALPTVDPNLVNACKAKNPKFGAGETGYTTPAKTPSKDQKSAPPAE